MFSGVTGLLDRGQKLKGTVVLMQKNTLDIDALTATKNPTPTSIIGGAIGIIGDVAGNIIDTATSFLGRSVALKLISATSADGNSFFLSRYIHQNYLFLARNRHFIIIILVLSKNKIIVLVYK